MEKLKIFARKLKIVLMFPLLGLFQISMALGSSVDGNIDSITPITGSYQYAVDGWACLKGNPVSIYVQIYAGGSAVHSGVLVGTSLANLSNGIDISKRCQSGGTKHRFKIILNSSIVNKYAGQSLSIHGLIPKGLPGSNVLLRNSGVLKFPFFQCLSENENLCVYKNKSSKNTIAIAQDTFKGNVTTHFIKSKGVQLGVSSYGGGYINQLILPGLGNILGKNASSFGRGGQSAFRDNLHSGRCNPTQAGFTDGGGTIVNIIQAADMMTILPREVSAWNGDGGYDFTENNNLAKDPYPGNLDKDKVVDKKNDQASEIRSDFDYYGAYKNCYDGNIIKIACFKVNYEYRFVRGYTESNFIKQFIFGTQENGNPVLNNALLNSGKSISMIKPHLMTPFDFGEIKTEFTLRFDNQIWNPGYRYFINNKGQLTSELRSGAVRKNPKDSHAPLISAIILSDSGDPNKGTAIAYYRPKNTQNENAIMRRQFNGAEIFFEDRESKIRLSDNPTRLNDVFKGVSRLNDMSLFGFFIEYTGLINPDNLNRSPVPIPLRQYESLRNEVYILVGTPSAIKNNILRIESYQE
jgi:hypothetical protein